MHRLLPPKTNSGPTRSPRSRALAMATIAILLAPVAHGDAVDELIAAEMVRQKIPGLGLMIMNGDAAPRLQGYGTANLEHGVAVTADTIFQSGSLGKQFTAAMVLMLAEQGRLDLDDALSKHFSRPPRRWRSITIRHLLTHTSGMKDYGNEVPLREELAEAELLEIMKRLPIEFEPGSDWRYSNSGYVVLGILVSKLTGAHWSEFLHSSVFSPVAMQTARMISDSDLVLHRAAGYTLNEDGELKNQDWVSATLLSTGDGALYFSVKDLAAWELALRERKLLNSGSYDAWWTPVTLSSGTTAPYGFGWGVDSFNGHPVIEHSGAWQGFQTFFARFEDSNLAIAVLCNVDAADPEKIVHDIASLLLPTAGTPKP